MRVRPGGASVGRVGTRTGAPGEASAGQLETDGTLRRLYGGAVKEALRHIVGVQFRNMATVGGSLAGRYGFSDVLTLFLALGTEAELYKGGRMPLRDYAAQKRDRDILTGVILPKNDFGKLGFNISSSGINDTSATL